MNDRDRVYADIIEGFKAIGSATREAAETGDYTNMPSAAYIRLALEWTKSARLNGHDPLDDAEANAALEKSLADAGEWDPIPELEDDGE